AFHLALDDLVRDQLQFFFEVLEGAAHEPLDAEDGVLGIGQRPFPCRRADQHGAVVVEADGAGNERHAILVAHYNRPAALDVRRQAEGGTQVDADDGGGGHGVPVPCCETLSNCSISTSSLTPVPP